MKAAQGIYCALVTPLNPDESVDVQAAQRIAAHMAEGGTDGILALGSTGEQIALTAKAKNAMIAAVRKAWPKPTLMVGCGSTSTALTLENVRAAQDLGADSVIITPPCFYPFDADALTRYYETIADQSRIPVYLYNISRFAGVRIPVETVQRLLAHPNIMGIKESDRDEDYLSELLQISSFREDFSVMQGSDRLLLSSLEAGCKAGVTVVGNLEPKLPVALYQAWKNGLHTQAQELQKKLLSYVQLITCLGRYPQELKALMNQRGLCAPTMTSPFLPLSPEQLRFLEEALAKLE